jgi:hypothetical protein
VSNLIIFVITRNYRNKLNAASIVSRELDALVEILVITNAESRNIAEVHDHELSLPLL